MSESAELAAKLRVEGERITAFFACLHDDDWERVVYSEETAWTVRSILAHLMTAERAFVRLLEQIRQGGRGVSEDFDIDRYNASQQRKTANMSTADLGRSFQEARAEMVAWVSGLADSDLEKQGRHPFLGSASLREMIKMVYLHNHLHYRDVRRTLRS